MAFSCPSNIVIQQMLEVFSSNDRTFSRGFSFRLYFVPGKSLSTSHCVDIVSTFL